MLDPNDATGQTSLDASLLSVEVMMLTDLSISPAWHGKDAGC